jgi:peroxiredoxin
MASKLGSYTSQEVNLTENWRAFASNYLKFRYIPADQPMLGIQPPLPVFAAKDLSGSMVDSKDIYKKGPAVVVIFSPKCSHCQDELTFLNSLYTAGELTGQFEVVAISILDKQTTADFINNQKYAFPVIADADKKLCSLFPSYTGSIPLSFVVDQSASIVSLHKGFDEYQRDIYLMELKKLAGLPNPPLLSKSGYSGEKTCAICHEKEHIQWKLTRHADAILSLVRKGEEDNDKCISCHVTGFGAAGGYDLSNKKLPKNLENVQCESCHGPGYQSCSAFTGHKQKKRKMAEWKKMCLSCHTKKESINFVFAKRYPRILHTNAPDFSTMSKEERLQFMRSFREKQNIFDNPAKYTGAASCRECHTKQYNHWEKTVHASAHTTEKAKAAAPEKLFRYNTGVGSAGGYPEQGREGVQCESCHGPGEKHLTTPKAKGHGYIVGLGSECSSCVVEQICRRCHSVADDPEFDFQKQIEEVRHK